LKLSRNKKGFNIFFNVRKKYNILKIFLACYAALALLKMKGEKLEFEA